MQLDPINALHALAASDVKKGGWRGVTRALEAHGTVVITNHDEPEAVVLPVDAYEKLAALAQQETARTESALEALRRRFDERLAALRAPDAAGRLRSAMRAGPRLRGKVKAGETY
jgi:PHD/YefM family antitoxin component YafN of YafNO toxin-antitoxin module